jgi:tRNA dimethylallyltransferase
VSKKLVVIAGPTAVGKTSVAIQVAKHYHTEIISADSRQIFKELEIGTAKPSATELARVKHHFINTHSIAEDYNAGAYGRDALRVIHELFRKHDTLILCGGSGLYIKAVLEGFDQMPEVPEVIREKLIQHYHQQGLPWLQEKLREVDPTYYEVVDIQNPHRLIRALELFEVSGQPMHVLRAKKKMEHEFEIIKIGLNLDREELYQRIDVRMEAMIEAGLFEEAEGFYPQRNLNALQTVGYTEIFDFMEGKYDREEAIRLLKRNSRRYAKRQLTWFTRDEEMHWFKPDQIEEMIKLIDS